MTDIVKNIRQLFKQSLDGRFLLFLTASFVSFFVLLLGLLFLTTVLVTFSATLLADSPIAAIFVSILFLLLGIIVFFLLSTIFGGFLFHFARDRLDHQALSPTRSWSQIKPVLKTAFLQQVLMGVVTFLVFLLVCLPLILSIYSFIQTPEGGIAVLSALDPQSIGVDSTIAAQAISSGVELFLEQNGSLMGLTAVVLIILIIIFTPFLLLFKTIPYFEKVRVGQSLRLAWDRSKKHFIFNWLFFILFFVITIILSLLIDLIVSSVTSLLGISPEAGILFALFLIGTILMQSYFMGLSSLFSVIVYEQNEPVSHFPSTPHAQAPPLKLPKSDKPKRPTYRKPIKRKTR